MSKRSSKFKRHERDFYETPFLPVNQLAPILQQEGIRTFAEPMCGHFALCSHLTKLGFLCNFSSDIHTPAVLADNPNQYYFIEKDVMKLTSDDIVNCDAIITNPPWPYNRKQGGSPGEPTVSMLHHMIDVAGEKPLYILIHSDFIHTRYFVKLAEYLRGIISVGRVSWADNGKAGFDNCNWLKFSKPWSEFYFIPNSKPTRFNNELDIDSVV